MKTRGEGHGHDTLPRKLFLVAVSTAIRPELGYLLVSAAAHNLRPELLGLGDARLSFLHREYSVKLEHVRKWLLDNLATHIVRPTDLVMHVDAYDVVLRGGEGAILQAWTDAGQPPVLVSVEKNLFPRRDLRPWFDAAADKHGAGSPYRYINSGTYMGEAQALAQVLTMPEMQGTGDDQGMLQAAWKAARPGLIALDYHRHVFHVPIQDTFAHAVASQSPVMHFAGTTSRPFLKPYFQRFFPTALQPEVQDDTHWLRLKKNMGTRQVSSSSSSSSTGAHINCGNNGEDKSSKSPATIGLAVALSVVFVACVVLAVLFGLTQRK
jgi:hypothetical protein